MVIMILYEFHLKDITDFNALIDNKTFFDQPVKKKTKQQQQKTRSIWKVYWFIAKSRNDDYTPGNWLDYFYHQTHWYRVIKTNKYECSF